MTREQHSFGYNETMHLDDVAQYLESLERENRFRVHAVLKESAFEITQRVTLIESDGIEYGPFIRKIIKAECGLGSAYEQLFNAQRAGYVYPHLPLIYECYRHDDNQIVVMEYVSGETLQDMVYRRDPSVQLAIEVFPGLCDALYELHHGFEPPIIHRDLKPSNLIIRNGVPIIIDFGISRTFDPASANDTYNFGTAAFAPPEQFGFEQTTVRSDIFALGMLLYFCLTEEIPSNQIRESLFNDHRIPFELRHVLITATAFDPADRYADVAQFKQAFLEACGLIQRTDSPVQPNNGQEEPVSQQSKAPFEGKPSQSMQQYGQTTGRMAVGLIWNIIVWGFFVHISGICISYVANAIVTGAYHGLQISGVVIALVFLIIFLALIAFFVTDKSRLKQRFPVLKKWQWWHSIIAFVILYGGTYILGHAIAAIVGL